MVSILIGLALVWPGCVLAEYNLDVPTKTATADGNATDVQNAIDDIDARDEDGWVLTIGSASGSGDLGGVSIDICQDFTVQGAGSWTAQGSGSTPPTTTAFEIDFGTATGIDLWACDGKVLRFYNFQMTGSANPVGIALNGGGSYGGGGQFHIQNLYIHDLPDRGIVTNSGETHSRGPLFGLISESYFADMDRGIYLHVSDQDLAWVNEMTWGTDDTFVVEDTIFYDTSWDPGLPAIDSNVQSDFDNMERAGIYWMVRRSDFFNWPLVAHGRQFLSSTLQVEVIDNNFCTDDASFFSWGNWRGGSLVAYGNTFAGDSTDSPFPGCGGANDDYGVAVELDPDNTMIQSVGWGTVDDMMGGWEAAEAGAPVYLCNNSFNGGGTSIDPHVSLTENVDYFTDTCRPGYTELEYPHPLRIEVEASSAEPRILVRP